MDYDGQNDVNIFLNDGYEDYLERDESEQVTEKDIKRIKEELSSNKTN